MKFIETNKEFIKLKLIKELILKRKKKYLINETFKRSQFTSQTSITKHQYKWFEREPKLLLDCICSGFHACLLVHLFSSVLPLKMSKNTVIIKKKLFVCEYAIKNKTVSLQNYCGLFLECSREKIHRWENWCYSKKNGLI